MAKGGYVGVSGSARKIKKGYVGVPTQKDALKFLEYIESTGTQYIDTGWKFGTVNYPNVSLEADVVITATSGTRITGVGAYTSFYYGVGVFGNGWACGNGHGDVNVSNSSYTIGARVKINYSLQTPLFTVKDQSNGNIIANSSFTPQTPQHSAVPFLLSAFKQSDTGAITPHAERIYSFKIFENENLVRDFVPCQNASGEIGMYDNVHDVFYPNAGTGTFIAGSVIEEVGGETVEVARKIKKAYMGVGGVARLIWSGAYNNDFFVLQQYRYTSYESSSPTYATLLKFNKQMELIAYAPSIQCNATYPTSSDGQSTTAIIDSQGNVYIGITLPYRRQYSFNVYKYSNDLSQQLGSYHTSFYASSLPSGEGFCGMCYDPTTNYIYISVSRSPYIAIIDCNTMSEINSFTSPSTFLTNIQINSDGLFASSANSGNGLPTQYNKNTIASEYTYFRPSGVTAMYFLYVFNEDNILVLYYSGNAYLGIYNKTETVIKAFNFGSLPITGSGWRYAVNIENNLIYFTANATLCILDLDLNLLQQISLNGNDVRQLLGNLWPTLFTTSLSDMDGNYIFQYYNNTPRLSGIEIVNSEGEIIGTTLIPDMPDADTLITDPELKLDQYNCVAHAILESNI